MKTLRESLFDTDQKNVDVRIGELYELSEVPHHNFFSNDPKSFMKLFKSKELKKWNYRFVDLKNNFIEYWERTSNLEGLAALIDIILYMPAEILNKPNAGRLIKDELKPYVNPSNYSTLNVMFRKIKDLFEISIYGNLFLSSPNSMKIMLKEK